MRARDTVYGGSSLPTVRSHRRLRSATPDASGHRASVRTPDDEGGGPKRWYWYFLGGLAGGLIAFALIIGFLPTGVVPVWESPPPPAGKLFPLVPADPTSPLPSEEQGASGSEADEETGRASRSGSRPADAPDRQPAPAPTTDVPRPTEAAGAAAAAPQPFVTVMPPPDCPPPLPPPAATRKPKASHPAPKGPKVQTAPTPSPRS